MIADGLAAGSVAACHRQSSESAVVHDHVRLGKDEIVAITAIGVRVGARNMKHTGPVGSGQTMGSRELSSGRGSTEMISNRCSHANRKVWSSASARTCCQRPKRGLWRPGFPIATPCTRASHTHLFCHLGPAQVLVTELRDLLC
jgi:hypothetical protein